MKIKQYRVNLRVNEKTEFGYLCLKPIDVVFEATNYTNATKKYVEWIKKNNKKLSHYALRHYAG